MLSWLVVLAENNLQKLSAPAAMLHESFPIYFEVPLLLATWPEARL